MARRVSPGWLAVEPDQVHASLHWVLSLISWLAQQSHLELFAESAAVSQPGYTSLAPLPTPYLEGLGVCADRQRS